MRHGIARWKRLRMGERLLLLTLPLALLALLGGGGQGLSAASFPCGLVWERVFSPNPRSSNLLESVSAVAADDVWAVGYMFDFALTPDETLTMHWDGSAWSYVPSPSPEPGSYLTDVVALATDNVWAVGYYYLGEPRTLIEQWNGSEWTVIPSPNQTHTSNELHAVAAVAPDDIWAIGQVHATHNTVTLHWDGVEWELVPSLPNNFSGYFSIEDAAAIATDDVWVVGSRYADGVSRQAISMHWDGSSWSQVPIPTPPSVYTSGLNGIVALGPDEVYAVGYYSNDGGATYRTLVMKWDGSAWSHMPSPNGSNNGYNILNAVTTTPDGEVWAVGNFHVKNFPTAPSNTLSLRWDGASWQIASDPNGSFFNSEWNGVAAAPTGELWAVGRSYDDYSSPWQTLTAHNPCEPVTPTPTVSPSATPILTPSATASPTASSTASRPPARPRAARHPLRPARPRARPRAARHPLLSAPPHPLRPARPRVARHPLPPARPRSPPPSAQRRAPPHPPR